MSPPVKTFMHIEQYSCIILLDKARICVHPKKKKKANSTKFIFWKYNYQYLKKKNRISLGNLFI